MDQFSVFISYSHKDEDWKDRLITHLGVLQKQGFIDAWEDRTIGGGEDWRQKIENAMNEAVVAILLVSANFLTSAFILKEEVPKLLARRENEGLRSAKAIGWMEIPRGHYTITFHCWVPSRSFHIITFAVKSEKVKFVSIRGTKLKWRKGEVLGIRLLKSREEE